MPGTGKTRTIWEQTLPSKNVGGGQAMVTKIHKFVSGAFAESLLRVKHSLASDIFALFGPYVLPGTVLRQSTNTRATAENNLWCGETGSWVLVLTVFFLIM